MNEPAFEPWTVERVTAIVVARRLLVGEATAEKPWMFDFRGTLGEYTYFSYWMPDGKMFPREGKIDTIEALCEEMNKVQAEFLP